MKAPGKLAKNIWYPFKNLERFFFQRGTKFKVAVLKNHWQEDLGENFNEKVL